MKPPRVRLRTLLILVGLAALVMAGVAMALRRPGRPYSIVFDKFDPVALLAAQPGFSVRGVTGSGIFNKARGGAFREWRGIITTPDDPLTLRTIQDRLDEYVKKVSQGRYHIEGMLEEVPTRPSRPPRLPSHLLFMFNEGDRHAEMHVWLFPDLTGPAIGYAISLQEGPLVLD